MLCLVPSVPLTTPASTVTVCVCVCVCMCVCVCEDGEEREVQGVETRGGGANMSYLPEILQPIRLVGSLEHLHHKLVGSEGFPSTTQSTIQQTWQYQ